MTEIEIRQSQVANVSFPNRIVELVVAPYESETTVEHRGRIVSEVISRGAFDGIDQQKNRVVKANRDHDLTKVVGRAVAFHPSRTEGLVAEVRIARGELGDNTLDLADMGALDGSAGFTLLWDKALQRVKEKAEVWETRTRRRLNHLWLHHIAFTPDPAYPDAQVLAVRAAAPPAVMPNLERLELARLRALAADIDRRYSPAQH